MEKIKQRFGAAAAKVFGVPGLDFSQDAGRTGNPGVGGYADELLPISRGGQLVQTEQLAPKQSQMEKEDPALVVCQAGMAVANFCDRTLERIPGWMRIPRWTRKHMAGEQFDECYNSRSDEVKEAITSWSGQTCMPKE